MINRRYLATESPGEKGQMGMKSERRVVRHAPEQNLAVPQPQWPTRGLRGMLGLRILDDRLPSQAARTDRLWNQ